MTGAMFQTVYSQEYLQEVSKLMGDTDPLSVALQLGKIDDAEELWKTRISEAQTRLNQFLVIRDLRRRGEEYVGKVRATVGIHHPLLHAVLNNTSDRVGVILKREIDDAERLLNSLEQLKQRHNQLSGAWRVARRCSDQRRSLMTPASL